MANNSMKRSRTKDDVIAEIRMLLGSDYRREKIIIVVEGDDDSTFFNRKTSCDARVIQSFSGKKGVEEIVDSFNDNRVIGICDLDYDMRSANSRVVYYDYSCLEMMIASNDSAFEAFSTTYYSGPLTPCQIRMTALQELQWLSLYRKLNTEQSWHVSFRGISIKNAFNSACNRLVISNIIAQLKTRNQRLSEIIREQVDMVHTKIQPDPQLCELLFLTQGHDFIQFLQAFFESAERGGKPAGERELSRSLLCSYRNDDFKSSKLYSALLEYQNRTGYSIVQ